MNPKGEQATSAALQAAAARGDWDAVNRYYAGKGESFAGMAAPGSNALYDMAFGEGVRGIKKRERAADVLRQGMTNQTQSAIAENRDQTLRDVEKMRSESAQGIAGRRDLINADIRDAATMQMDIANRARYAEEYLKTADTPEAAMARSKMTPEQKKAEETRIAGLRSFLTEYAGGKYSQFFAPPGYADGGPVSPVGNPMGTFGQPPVMQSLDPAVREYGQYVHAATMNGLQPVPFGKFINLLATARQQMQTLPTTGGQYGFADGGMVSWLQGLFAPPQQPQAPTQTPQQRLGQGAAMLGGGMAGQAAQAIQGRNAALEEALGAARGARTGYAAGGAIPVAGRQVLGPGGPRDDAIPAVVDGTKPAALSSGEFVMPTDVTQYWGTAKLQQMIDKARSQ
jgi:hypothetical protein